MGGLLEETPTKPEGSLATAKLCKFYSCSREGKKIKITGGRARNESTVHNLFDSVQVCKEKSKSYYTAKPKIFYNFEEVNDFY